VASLDSSFLIDLLSGEPHAVDKAAELDRSAEARFITPPAASEVMLGASRLGGAYFNRAKALIDNLAVLAFDRPAATWRDASGPSSSSGGFP